MTINPKVLAVDDEPYNLQILTDYLEGAGYEVVTAENGLLALEKLEANPDVDVILLDRMMPHMTGMDVFEKIKANVRLREIPVIMQTAAATSAQVLDGIEAGVYYYLTKPYGEQILLSVVKAALTYAQNKKEMKKEVLNHKPILGMMEQSRFRFRTQEEAQTLAYIIASCMPSPELTVYGVHELLINAIEHGNYGITYEEKTKLLLSGSWQEEMNRRAALPENINKFAHLSFQLEGDIITLHIKDEGAGFDWRKYMEVSPERVTNPNGRGIAIAKKMSFHSLEYLGNGNEVLCKIKLNTM